MSDSCDQATSNYDAGCSRIVNKRNAERNRLYRQRHREEINRRRREMRRRQQKLYEIHFDSNVELANEMSHITQAMSSDELRSKSHIERQQRYYERHKEEINKRKRDSRRKQNVSQDPEERNDGDKKYKQLRYYERHKEEINKRKRENRRKQNISQKHPEERKHADKKYAPTTKPKAQKPVASTSCEQENKTKIYSPLPIIAKVYLFLEKEYYHLKSLNGNNCDLSPLEDILRRTSEATGVSEEDVISILDAEELSDHLPPRARSKRRKILQHSTEHYRKNEDLIEDDDMLQEENDNVTVKLEITEDTESEYRLTHSSCNVDYGTPATDVTQVKSEPQVRVCPQTDSIRYLEVTPLTSTSGVEYTIQTKVKLEQEEDETMTDNLLLPNRHGSNNSVEDTTQTKAKPDVDETMSINSLQSKSNPSNEPTSLEPADTAIKLEPEDID